LLEGDQAIAPDVECVLYENTHTPGRQCVHVETVKGTASIVEDVTRKVDLNIDQGIPRTDCVRLAVNPTRLRNSTTSGELLQHVRAQGQAKKAFRVRLAPRDGESPG
jgi:hypothetical protein